MKKLRKLIVVTALFAFTLAGCKKKTEKKESADPKYQIYEKAVNAGYSGTYEEWLDSIKGDEIELRVDNGYVQMKYKKTSTWTNLIELESLKGKDGSAGLSIKSELQVSNGYIQWKNENETTWKNLISLEDLTGKEGSKVVFNVDNGYINYKYENTSEWVELISLDTLTGESGKNVTLSVDGDYIVWKNDGDTSWNNLIDLDTLKGDKGDKSMMQVSNGYIQWKNESDTTWNNLISLELLKGENGKEVEFRTDSGYIQWKYKTDSEWTNLYKYLDVSTTYNVRFIFEHDKDITLPISISDYLNQTVPAYSKVVIPEEISLFVESIDDYVFDGWYYNDEKWNLSGCVVTEDMVLEARFVLKTVHIYVENLDGIFLLTNTINAGDSYICNYGGYAYFTAYNLDSFNTLRWTISYEIDGEIYETSIYDKLFKVYDMNRDIHLTVEKVEIYGREDDRIYFGYYPQTLEQRDTVISTLNAFAGMLPTATDNYNWTDCNYYIKSEVESYMWYIDLDTDFDGRYDYRGVYFIKYRPTNISSDSLPENATQDNNGYDTGKVYWFKYEIIEWNILNEENNKALLIANIMLDTQEYCESDGTDAYLHNNDIGYANNYELSNIRLWLNVDFYNTAFSDLEKEYIAETTVDNSAATTASQTNIYACDDTLDYVFLLSYSEVLEYYPEQDSRIATGSDYAKCQGLFTNDQGDSQWRLRSPNANASNSASYVTSGGELKVEYVDIISRGVRPAIVFIFK